MIAEQLMVKFFVEDASTLDLGELIPVFHGWIQNRRLDELLIDVADYRHVHQGPGVILVGHGTIWAMDGGEGRLGLQHTRKRFASGTPEKRLETAFRSALTACVRLEEEPSLKGRLRFRGNELLIRLNDRLNAPNTGETLATVKPEFEGFLGRLYAGTGFTLKHRSGPEEMFGLEVTSPQAVDAGTLLGRIA